MNEPDWNTAFPKFLIGDSPDSTFVVHLHHPRFVAELIEDTKGETVRPALIDEPVADPGSLAKTMRQAGPLYGEEIERDGQKPRPK